LIVLETQLLLKGICTKAEWQAIKEEVSYDFINDMHFTEMKEVEILKERLGILGDVDGYVGKYFSKEWVRKHVLRQTEDDIEEIDKQMEEEAEMKRRRAGSDLHKNLLNPNHQKENQFQLLFKMKAIHLI
jgi:hypothetical protein